MAIDHLTDQSYQLVYWPIQANRKVLLDSFHLITEFLKQMILKYWGVIMDGVKYLLKMYLSWIGKVQGLLKK